VNSLLYGISLTVLKILATVIRCGKKSFFTHIMGKELSHNEGAINQFLNCSIVLEMTFINT
jgi:hypothetical protein